MSNPWFNTITFTSYGADPVTLNLELEGDLTLTPGVSPNVWRFRCSWREYDQLGDRVGRTGRLDFYGRDQQNEDGSPRSSAQLSEVTIIDVEPIVIGRPADAPPPLVTRVIEYRIYIADARHAWVHPRGGVLMQGEINRRPYDEGGLDANGLTQQTNVQLIEKCLAAMGVPATVPTGANSAPYVQDLNWRATHAPSELGRILDHCGATIYPLRNGGFRISMIGGDNEPELPGDEEAVHVDVPTYPGLSRRGATVVITSAPNAVVDYRWVEGPSSTTWKYVVQDVVEITGSPRTLKWKALGESMSLAGLSAPLTTIEEDFANIDDRYRERVRSQLYRCIRMGDGYEEGRILRRIPTLVSPLDIIVEAEIAVEVAGVWVNKWVRCHPLQIIDGRIIVVAERLLCLADEGEDPDADAAELSDGQLRVQLATERLDIAGRPEFYVSAFQRGTGGIVDQLDVYETENALADPATIVLSHPELTLYVEEGVEKNRDALDEAAKKLAERYLAGSDEPVREVRIRGFESIELNGKVSELRYSQSPPQTIVRIGTWFLPAGAAQLVPTEDGSGVRLGAFPHQIGTAAQHAYEGSAGRDQPVVPLEVPPAARGGVLAPGDTIYQVLQMTSNTAYGWNFVRAHA